MDIQQKDILPLPILKGVNDGVSKSDCFQFTPPDGLPSQVQLV